MKHVVLLNEKYRTNEYEIVSEITGWLYEKFGPGDKDVYDDDYNFIRCDHRYRNLYAYDRHRDGGWHSTRGIEKLFAIAFENGSDAELFKLTWG